MMPDPSTHGGDGIAESAVWLRVPGGSGGSERRVGSEVMRPEGEQREQAKQRRGGAQNGEVGPLAHAALQAAELTETRIATAEGRADRAEQAIVGERARADAVRARLDAMQEQLVRNRF